MAADDDTPYDPDECHACRGRGGVISNKGGEQHEVPCPWCDGTGRFIAEHDAQAARRGTGEDTPAPAGADAA